MGPIDDSVLERRMALTPEALTILETRYLLRDKEGKATESPEQMCLRLAVEAAKAGVQYEGNTQTEQERVNLFYWLLVESLFSPNSPTWMNAGTNDSQNAACFVLPVEDSLPRIFDAVRGAALIHQSGGGTGFDFSSLRPRGDVVRSTGGVASGPVSFMTVFNSATEIIKQGGKRRGANIGILRVDHPDIESFITCKVDNSALSNFNISVGITDSFMAAVEADESYDLVNPRTRESAGVRRAQDIFGLIVDHAWRNGEPGVVFLDRLEEKNPTPAIGRITATNPCGEQPLLPYEACHLGSVNLQKMHREEPASSEQVLVELGLDAGWADHEFAALCAGVLADEIRHVNWSLLRTVVHSAVDFLDSIIDVSRYPLPEIDRMVRTTRKIGLGFMGLADLFIMLKVAYASEKAELLSELIARFITREAKVKSCALAVERGPFPAFADSVFAKAGDPPIRNATVTTVAPTGTISMIANASSGCEPLFGVAFTKQNVLGGKTLTQVNALFLADAKRRGIYSDELMEKIAANGGSLDGIEGIPADMVMLYRTALEIPWEWHARIQAAVQRGIDNAVSKTINLPYDATRDDVKQAFLLAHRLRCKGITVYRSGSRESEVISSKRKPEPKLMEEAPTPRGRKPYTVDSTLWGRLQPIDRPETLCGVTKRIATPSGTLWATMNLYDSTPFEMFCQIGRAGTDIYAFTESIARLISLSLRAGIDPTEVARQLRGIGGSGQIGFGPNRVLSVPDAIGRMLEQCIQSKYAGPEWATPPERGIAGQSASSEAAASGPEGTCDSSQQATLPFVGNGGDAAESDDDSSSSESHSHEDGHDEDHGGHGKHVTRHDLCPQCGNYSLIYASGCSECKLCGYSAC
ncbi:MAG: adenosylcobalamin-dependent ribonucleoside-diphosphate reductase [Clostridia bacterium]|nr:adenosylcobalamin-dependent ribonucleoside-diphosphate reductase [Clostridia bacterium]